ncbi:MAG: ATP-dependent dethiobiotin synthetase BioD [Opitutales bacterium]|nr:ATP-dependent dethiobiotin synthetase BioD [Opitutales bacterium]
MAVYFVSGIDTSCGKTFVTGVLARREIGRGKKVITQKFVQTGCEGFSEDIEAHRKAMGAGLFDEDKDGATCPYIFKFPASAHLASRMENVEIDLDRISRATKILSQKYDTVFIEGAGGLMVPVTENFLTIDYILREKLPLILVVSAKLGSINHALLSLEVCKIRGVNVAKIVYNDYPKVDPRLGAETCAYVKKYAAKNFPDAEFLTL